MERTRHRLTTAPLDVVGPSAEAVSRAESLANAGNWYLAGETYADAADQARADDTETRAKLLVRAAACFDVSGQRRAAARAYGQAAAELEKGGNQFGEAGELYNRSALQFRDAGEYFNAGNAWRRAASAFASVSDAVLSALDNLSPVPSAAGKYTVAGGCYTAAGDAFLLAGDEGMWACGTYWEAGRAHSTQGHGYHAFVAYRKALKSVARFYGTHDREALRCSLPLSEQERTSKLDPLAVMEQAAYESNLVHQLRNSGMLPEAWARTETDRQMIAAYHDFYLTFAASGNSIEATNCRIAEKLRTQRLMFANHRYGRAALYWFWGATSEYGEGLFRWAATCVFVLLVFLYAAFHLIAPVSNWFDYCYFSVVTFTSLGYGDIHPVGAAGKAAACVEVMSGLVMFGLLLTFIGSRFQRT